VTDKRRVRPDAPDDGSSADSPEGTNGAEATGPAEAPKRKEATELERARAEAAEYLDHLRRLKAEFENYRKRMLREQTQAVELAAGPLVRSLLEVLDEFELALGAAEQHPEAQRFAHGVQMVYAKLMDILKAEGLERIEAEDAPFDPELHEALLQSEAREGEPYVEDVLRTGYTLKGTVLRPAGVKVGRR
jgi:molecular chaperone GrpE